MENKIICGDCIEEMKKLPDNSVDAIITDPPYELGFMGKSWDNSGIANNVSMWKECLRVIKPGGHLLSFGGTRTYHRMACAKLGYNFIGIEKEPEYVKIAEARIKPYLLQEKLL